MRLDLAFAHADCAANACSEPGAIPSGGSGYSRIMRSEELATLEKDNIVAALERARWKISGNGGAAELLAMNPNTLASRMRSLDIRRSRVE